MPNNLLAEATLATYSCEAREVYFRTMAVEQVLMPVLRDMDSEDGITRDTVALILSTEDIQPSDGFRALCKQQNIPQSVGFISDQVVLMRDDLQAKIEHVFKVRAKFRKPHLKALRNERKEQTLPSTTRHIPLNAQLTKAAADILVGLTTLEAWARISEIIS